MESLIKVRLTYFSDIQLRRSLLFLVGVIGLMLPAIPAYAQFADLPRDTKTVDVGVNGDGASQTFSFTTVIPIRQINGWTGVFGSRASGEENVFSEIVKAHAQGGFRIRTFGIEVFTDLERNIAKGSALTSQIGSYIRPAIYEGDELRISGGIGAFIENIQPLQDIDLRQFDPTTFRWLAFSSVGWRKLNTVLKFTPQIGFKNFQFSAEPAITFSLSTRLGLRLSGAVTYNSEPLTENWHYKYLSILRFTL